MLRYMTQCQNSRSTLTVLSGFILLLAACEPASSAESVESVVVDTFDVPIVTSDIASSDVTCTISEDPVLVIGENEEDENHWFSHVRGVGRLSDGSIVAVDRSSAEVRSMGRHGEGPGEFQDPFILWVTAGDTIWVGDYRPWRYNLFTAQGEFVRRVSLDPAYLNPSRGGGVLDNGYTVNSWESWGLRGDFKEADTLIVELHDPSGRLVGNLVRMPSRMRGYVSEDPDLALYPLFQSFPEIDARGSTIILAHGSKAEVRVLDDEFNLRMIVRWDDPDRKVTRADVRAWREDYVENQNQQTFFGDAIISDERPVADFFPAISQVMIGGDGHIWVRQYDRPREDRGWLAFGTSGEFICHMAALPGDVKDFGPDYVLLLHETELGPDTIRMYRLAYPKPSTGLDTGP